MVQRAFQGNKQLGRCSSPPQVGGKPLCLRGDRLCPRAFPAPYVFSKVLATDTGTRAAAARRKQLSGARSQWSEALMRGGGGIRDAVFLRSVQPAAERSGTTPAGTRT